MKAGNETGLPVMVDFGQITKDRNIDTLFLDKLRPGDIYTHCFSGHREELLENGKLNPAMVEGRKRKIIFDIGFGQASFYWYVAVPAYQAGFHPDSISTDLHTNSMNGGMKNYNNVMTAILALGSPIADVVRMSTWAPAQEIHRPQLGNLDVGAEADIAVLRVEKGTLRHSRFRAGTPGWHAEDCYGNDSAQGQRGLRPEWPRRRGLAEVLLSERSVLQEIGARYRRWILTTVLSIALMFTLPHIAMSRANPDWISSTMV